jgi:Na+/phosphate symporter
MSDMQFDGWRVIQVTAWVVTAVAAIILAPLKWIVQKAVATLEQHDKQIDVLEKTAVTRAELEAALQQLRTDRLAMHQENVGHLVRIEDKMEDNAVRETTARNELRTAVNTLNVQVAVLVDRANKERVT